MTLLRFIPHFRRAQSALQTLENRESWSRDDIAAFQLEKLNALWKQGVEQTRIYQKLQRELRLPRQFSSVQEFSQLVPPLAKKAVQQSRHDFLAANATSGSWHRTGGSTGSPTVTFWSTEAHRQNLLARYRCQQMWNVNFLARQAMLWGYAPSFEPMWKGKLARITQPLIDWMRGRLRLSAYNVGPQDLRKYLQAIAEYRPDCLYGYSAAILLLAQCAVDIQWSCPTMKLAILTGEPAFGWLKKVVEAGLRTPTSIEYGSVECGIVANEWPDRKLHVRDDMIFLETLPRDDGNYDVVVTSLINTSFPLLRYRVGDVVEQPIERPEAGFGYLHSIMGRQNDMLRSRSGRLVHSLSVKHALEHYDNVRRFRAHQDDTGKLNLLVESGSGSIDKPHIREQLESLLDGFPVEVAEVEAMPNNSAGKHRWVISELVEVD